MKLSCQVQSSGRHYVLLAPSQSDALGFDRASVEPSRHRSLLQQAQRLRGRIYVEDGAVLHSDLSPDERHIQAADDYAWHLLTVDENEAVVACIRYHAHGPSVSYPELSIAGSNISRSTELGNRIQRAVETELDCAKRRGIWYVELGGWAMCESLRCTTEAVRTLLTVYALSQLRGGAIGLSSATARHHSSSILRRIGGKPLNANGMEVPSYFDPQYDCEMELISFDSAFPNQRYSGWISECRELLHQIPVVLDARGSVGTSDLLRFHAAVGGHSGHPTKCAEFSEMSR